VAIILNPFRRTTPAEWAVLFWLIFIALLAVGGMRLYAGLTATPEEAAQAAEDLRWGLTFLGTAAGTLIVRWAARRWAGL
jgi:hypothetical protein